MIECCIAGKYCKNSNNHSHISMASCSIALYFKEEGPSTGVSLLYRYIVSVLVNNIGLTDILKITISATDTISIGVSVQLYY